MVFWVGKIRIVTYHNNDVMSH